MSWYRMWRGHQFHWLGTPYPERYAPSLCGARPQARARLRSYAGWQARWHDGWLHRWKCRRCLCLLALLHLLAWKAAQAPPWERERRGLAAALAPTKEGPGP